MGRQREEERERREWVGACTDPPHPKPLTVGSGPHGHTSFDEYIAQRMMSVFYCKCQHSLSPSKGLLPGKHGSRHHCIGFWGKKALTVRPSSKETRRRARIRLPIQVSGRGAKGFQHRVFLDSGPSLLKGSQRPVRSCPVVPRGEEGSSYGFTSVPRAWW